MSGLIPPMVSSSPPPLDDNFDDEEEDEFGDFAAADLSYGFEAEVMVAPKTGDLEVPTAEPRLCNGDSTSQDSVISGATDSGLCSASEEGGDREKDVMTVSSDQETMLVVSTCDTLPVLNVDQASTVCSSSDSRIILPHSTNVDCGSEISIPSKELTNVLSTLPLRVSDTCEDKLNSLSNACACDDFGVTESSSVVPVEICKTDMQDDTNIPPVSEQSVDIVVPSISMVNASTHCIESTVTCQVGETETGDSLRLFPNSRVAQKVENLPNDEEFGSFTEFSNVDQFSFANSKTSSRTNVSKLYDQESVRNKFVPQNKEDQTVEDFRCENKISCEKTSEVAVVDFKSASIEEQFHSKSDCLENAPEGEISKQGDEIWVDFSSFTSATQNVDDGFEAEFADFSSAASIEKQKASSSDWADVSVQDGIASAIIAGDDFEDFDSIASATVVPQDYDLLESAVSNMFPTIADGASCSADSTTLTCNRVWEQLRDLETSHALLYQWSGSAGNKLLLSALGIDARNILFGPRWNVSVPRFAANLGLSPLEPVRATNSACTVSSAIPHSTDTKTEDVPAAQFDWNGSGLVNPLDSPQQRKTDLMAQQRSPLVLSVEALSVLENLPDLSFLRAHLLMFPVHSGDAPSSSNAF